MSRLQELGEHSRNQGSRGTAGEQEGPISRDEGHKGVWETSQATGDAQQARPGAVLGLSGHIALRGSVSGRVAGLGAGAGAPLLHGSLGQRQ